MDISPLMCRRCGTLYPDDTQIRAYKVKGQGYVPICVTCLARQREQIHTLTCRCCHQTRSAAEHFRPSATTKSGYLLICRDCEATARQQREEAVQAQQAQARAALVARHRGQIGRSVLFWRDEPMPPGQVIYVLTDPRDNAVRYVGRTNTLKRRYKEHLKERPTRDRRIIPLEEDLFLPTLPGVGPRAKSAWIAELRAMALRPEMRILEEVDPPELVHERESRWIFHYLQQGAKLLNATKPNTPLWQPLVRLMRRTPLDFVHEPLDSLAWLPLAELAERLRNAERREVEGRQRLALMHRDAARRQCCATNLFPNIWFRDDIAPMTTETE